MPMVPNLPGVHVEEVPFGPPTIVGVDTSTTAFVGRALKGPLDEPVTVTSVAEFASTFDAPMPDSGLGYAVRDFFDNGGRRAVVVRIAKDGSDAEAPDAATYFPAGDGQVGVRALLKAEPFNLLVLPPAAVSGQVPDAVWADAVALARSRRAFLIVDPPPTATASTVAGWTSSVGLAGKDARNAALYFPRLQAADPSRRGAPSERAASGAVAGLYARFDNARGVWTPPGGRGAVLAGTRGPTVNLTEPETARLASDSVNAIRSFRGTGTVVWGARTLYRAEPSAVEFTYVSVRRLALFLQESLDRGTEWAAFEPNAEPLWAQLRGCVDTFLLRLYHQGAFLGTRPQDAYFVRCGPDTMTQTDIDSGLIIIEVGFAPVKPAEFVMFTIRQQSATQED